MGNPPPCVYYHVSYLNFCELLNLISIVNSVDDFDIHLFNQLCLLLTQLNFHTLRIDNLICNELH